MERVEGRGLENPDRLSSCSITLCWLWQDDSFPTHAHELFCHRHHGLQEGHEESIRTSAPAHRLRDVSSQTRGPERAPTFRARKVALVMPAVTCTLTSQLAPRSCPLGQLQSAPVSAVLVFLLGQTSKLKQLYCISGVHVPGQLFRCYGQNHNLSAFLPPIMPSSILSVAFVP